MNSNRYKALFLKIPVKISLLLVYLVSVNLLAGYVAVWFRFPSLWGNSQIFLDYSMPFGLTWASAHIPSMILVSILLLRIPNWNEKQIQRFRIICLSLFFILIYGVLEKVPFALFPAVDLLVAFFFSLIMVPPSYKENPKLTIGLSIFLSLILISSSYFLYTKWQHRAPEIKETVLMDGLFKLNDIDVHNVYPEITFKVALTKMIPQSSICDTAIEMTTNLFNTYRFDESYKKIVELYFEPKKTETKKTVYRFGVLEQYKKDDKIDIFCHINEHSLLFKNR